MSIGSSDNVINRKPQVIDYEPYYQSLKEDTDELYELVNVCRSQGSRKLKKKNLWPVMLQLKLLKAEIWMGGAFIQ